MNIFDLLLSEITGYYAVVIDSLRKSYRTLSLGVHSIVADNAL